MAVTILEVLNLHGHAQQGRPEFIARDAKGLNEWGKSSMLSPVVMSVQCSACHHLTTTVTMPWICALRMQTTSAAGARDRIKWQRACCSDRQRIVLRAVHQAGVLHKHVKIDPFPRSRMGESKDSHPKMKNKKNPTLSSRLSRFHPFELFPVVFGE